MHQSSRTITRLSTARAFRDELAEDVAIGLIAEPRWLPPKYFYDSVGSELFEQITQLATYYPTRAETEILEREAAAIIAATRPVELLELGSGSSKKTRLLLDAMHASGSGDRYVPLDVSEDALRQAADALMADRPWLEVHALLGDLHHDLPRVPPDGRRLLAFLGSTIGNLDRAERAVLFQDVADLLRPGDHFLLGADLVKDPSVLLAAYDEPEGVTAAFNRNVLTVVARELGATIPVGSFAHEARWNHAEERIEMWLTAMEDVELDLPSLGLTVAIPAGDGIRTELSCKFRRDGLTRELEGVGLRVERWLTDAADRFALVLAAAAAHP